MTLYEPGRTLRSSGVNACCTWLLYGSQVGPADAHHSARCGRYRGPGGMIDLTTAFDDPRVGALWPEPPGRAIRLDATCVWPDAVTALCGSTGALIRVPVTEPGAATLLAFADVAIEPGSDSPYLVVPVPHVGVS